MHPIRTLEAFEIKKDLRFSHKSLLFLVRPG
jgi:hypothetical protein